MNFVPDAYAYICIYRKNEKFIHAKKKTRAIEIKTPKKKMVKCTSTGQKKITVKSMKTHKNGTEKPLPNDKVFWQQIITHNVHIPYSIGCLSHHIEPFNHIHTYLADRKDDIALFSSSIFFFFLMRHKEPDPSERKRTICFSVFLFTSSFFPHWHTATNKCGQLVCRFR